MQEIKVPEVGESITEGLLVAWLQEDGSQVQADDPLFELETDKITMEVPSPSAGRLTIEVAAGETVQVGQRVGTVDPSATAAASPAQESPAQAETPAPTPSPDSAPAPRAESAPAPAPAPAPRAESVPARPGVPGFGPSTPGALASAPRLNAPAGRAQMREKLQSRSTDPRDLSPAVRRLVMEHQLDADAIPPSGPGGRVTKADVLSYLERTDGGPVDPTPAAGVPSVSDDAPRLSARPAPAAGSGTVPTGARQTRAKMSPLRARIAERLVQAQQNAAMLTTFNEVDMSAILSLRSRHKEAFEKKHGVRLGFMSFFVKAAVDALQTLPQVNAFIDGDEIVTNHFYDIGVAVGTDKGLVVPVIRGCDQLGFAEIEAAIGDYARKVRDKKIGLEDLQGGCFTLSNGGIYGSLLSTPILNPPQSAILGMHAIKKRPVVVDDEIVIRPMMYLALSYDHRIVDGKDAVTFLRRIVECLEQPERMLLQT